MVKSRDFLHAAPGQMSSQIKLGTHLFASEGTTGAQTTCMEPRKIRSVKTLEKMLCYNARYAVDRLGRKVSDRGRATQRWELNPGACIECESQCEYGMERLRRLKIHELLELGCGGDCLTCPEPCRVYRLALGKICDEEVKKSVKRKQAEAFAREALGLYMPKEQAEKG